MSRLSGISHRRAVRLAFKMNEDHIHKGHAATLLQASGDFFQRVRVG